MNLESVFGESLQCNITASSVTFLSPTELAATMNVNFEVKNTKRATLSVQKAAATAR